MVERVTTSMKLDPEVRKAMKKHCIDLDVDMSDYLEDLIRKDLKLKRG